jgi:hypothetical protein
MKLDRQWKIARNPMWVVLDQRGGPWMVSASILTKNRAIAKFVKDARKPWRYWYRAGYRCRFVTFKWRTVR